jgi:hypothetical protein
MSKRKILSRWRRSLTQCLETRVLILADHKHLDIHNLTHGRPSSDLSITEGHVTVHSHLMVSIQQVSYNQGRHVFYNVSEAPMTSPIVLC